MTEQILKPFTQYKTPVWSYIITILFVLLIGAVVAVGVYVNNAKQIVLGDTIWKSYTTVTMTLVENPECKTCGNDEIAANVPLTLGPSVQVRRVAKNSLEGQKMIDQYNIKALPHVVLSESMNTLPDFARFEQGLDVNADGSYSLSAVILQVPTPEFLSTPEVSDADASFGPKDAALTIIEFSDFECPFCVRGAGVVSQLKAEYGDTVHFVFKHLPLDQLHPNARAAAAAAVCADKQDNFWEMHDRMFANQKDLTQDNFVAWATEFGMDVDTFTTCLSADQTAAQVQSDADIAREYGISGTPAFFVGDQLLAGAYPYEQFKAIIDAKLAE
ncbi:MAG: thioredoxin domain-containing protein [Patescibacteria group bacterium]|nr:thioredoxin domain-containing protein [Patescibacteria group bacterium]